MQWSRLMLLPVLLVALMLAACGGPAASADGNGGNGGDESQAAEATDTPEPDESEGNGGNGGNGGSGAFDDLDQLAEDLTPPNSDETSRTEAGSVLFITWESSDSPDDLEGFHEDAIGNTGLDIFSQTSAEGSFSWIFGIEEGSSAGGVLSISPSGDGSGSLVGLQIGSAES